MKKMYRFHFSIQKKKNRREKMVSKPVLNDGVLE